MHFQTIIGRRNAENLTVPYGTCKSALENDSYRNHVTVKIRAIVKLDYRLYYLLLKHMKILEFCEGFSALFHRRHFDNLRK